MSKHKEGKTAGDAAARSVPETRFQAVVLVCRQCEGRKDGPEHLDSRQARKDLKHALRDQRPKARVVESSCLGTCPKKALMVAGMRSGQALRGVEASSAEDLERFARALQVPA